MSPTCVALPISHVYRKYQNSYYQNIGKFAKNCKNGAQKGAQKMKGKIGKPLISSLILDGSEKFFFSLKGKLMTVQNYTITIYLLYLLYRAKLPQSWA